MVDTGVKPTEARVIPGGLFKTVQTVERAFPGAFSEYRTDDAGGGGGIVIVIRDGAGCLLATGVNYREAWERAAEVATAFLPEPLEPAEAEPKRLAGWALFAIWTLGVIGAGVVLGQIAYVAALALGNPWALGMLLALGALAFLGLLENGRGGRR